MNNLEFVSFFTKILILNGLGAKRLIINNLSILLPVVCVWWTFGARFCQVIDGDLPRFQCTEWGDNGGRGCAFSYVMPLLKRRVGDRTLLSVKQTASASPATGSAHEMEEKTLMGMALGAFWGYSNAYAAVHLSDKDPYMASTTTAAE